MPSPISIDKEKCIGCGQCVRACHEGVLELVDGKATLVSPDFCDGMGNCLPACPQGAITFKELKPVGIPVVGSGQASAPTEPARSNLGNWPIQMRLAPIKSPVFDGDLVIAADCTAFADAGFQEKITRGKTLIIGCPKLDPGEWVEKLTAIFEKNDVNLVEVVRMSVPCCGGLPVGVKEAISKSGRDIPMSVRVIKTPIR